MQWQEYLETLADIGPYLERIGLRRDEIGMDEASLSRLIRAHIYHIPFENIDVFDRELPILLDTERLYDKIVTNRRGGYCFELNALFTGLLRALGFDVLASACRVMRGGTEIKPVRHRGVIVTIDGERFYCDVGFGGPSFPGAVPLSGARRTCNGQTFWIEPFDGHWMRLCRLVLPWERDDYPDNREENCELLIGTYANLPADFAAYNAFCCGDPHSPFRTHRRVHLRTETGFYELVNDQFSIRRGETIETRNLQTREEIQAVLREYFFIDLALAEIKTTY